MLFEALQQLLGSICKFVLQINSKH